MRILEYLKSTKWVIFWGTLIRLFFAPFTGHPYDLTIWMESGKLMAMGISPYSPYTHLGQTILWAYWTGIAFIGSMLVPGRDPFVYIFFLKLLPIIADLGVCYVIIKLIEEETQSPNLNTIRNTKPLNENKIKLFTALVYINPVFIFASSFWAMTDSLALFCLLQSYRRLRDDLFHRSIILLTIAIALKLYPVILLPAYLLYIIIYKQSFWNATRYGILTVILFFIISYVPFLFLPWEASQISGVLSAQTNRYFGGMGTLGFLTISLEVSILGNFIEPINSNLSSIFFVRFLWFFNSLLFTGLIFGLHKTNLVEWVENQFEGFVLLCLLFYSLWILFASWVSEQNFVPLLGFCYVLLFYQMINKEDDINSMKNILFFQTSVVTSHILINVPLPLFFFIILPASSNILSNNAFLEFRAIYLSILIICSSSNLIYLFKISWGKFLNRTKLYIY